MHKKEFHSVLYTTTQHLLANGISKDEIQFSNSIISTVSLLFVLQDFNVLAKSYILAMPTTTTATLLKLTDFAGSLHFKHSFGRKEHANPFLSCTSYIKVVLAKKTNLKQVSCFCALELPKRHFGVFSSSLRA